jgi:hypothetical protein
MPTTDPTETIQTIDPAQLATVAGGTTSNDQLTTLLTQITSSIKDLAANRNQGSDPTQMMLMMMMMGGFGGGGGGGGYVAAPAAGPPVVNVDTSVLGRSGGWFAGGGGRCGGGGCRGGGSKKGW